MDGEVNGITTSFLLDTGASTTLLRKDTWERVKAPSQKKLTPCLEQRLVSVDGSPLQVHGRAMVEFKLAGEIFQLEVTVVSPLTSEAILGLDFLRQHRVTIDLGNQQMLFRESNGQRTPLKESAGPKSVHSIRVVETIQIPPCSETMVMAETTGSIDGGVMVGGEQLGPATARSCRTSPGGAEVWESPRAITERKGEDSHRHSRVGDCYSGISRTIPGHGGGSGG